jgi:hypothetical protein
MTTHPPASELLGDDAFFHSVENPVATADQRDLEMLALEVMETVPITEAIEVATMRFETLAGAYVPDDAKAGLPERVREAAFRCVTMALNSDPSAPKVLGNVLGPPHEWFGMQIPGSRGPGTGENADCWYSAVPLDPYSRFELLGKVSDPPIGDCPMYVCGNAGLTHNVSSLDWRDVVVDDEGSFVVTIDPQPAGGRPNHLQTAIDAKYLFLRDCREVWSQKPNAYRVRRLDPPLRAEMTVQEKSDLAARYIVEDVPLMWWFRHVMASLEPNTITPPTSSGPVGGMASQALVRGRVALADGEAFVLTLSSGGAEYWSLASYDWWAMSGDVGGRLTSYNQAQTAPSSDGTTTFVFAASDPGAPNWVDTAGRTDTHFLHRWQKLPQAAEANGPTASAQVVDCGDLPKVLPDDTAWVSPEGRAQQLAERAAQFDQRYQV